MKVVVRQEGGISVATQTTTPTKEVIIRQEGSIKLSTQITTPTKEVTVREIGPEGPQGIPGPEGPAGADGSGSGIANLADAKDVDMSNLEDGSLLVFNGGTFKWTATNTIEDQYIEGGHF